MSSHYLDRACAELDELDRRTMSVAISLVIQRENVNEQHWSPSQRDLLYERHFPFVTLEDTSGDLAYEELQDCLLGGEACRSKTVDDFVDLLDSLP